MTRAERMPQVVAKEIKSYQAWKRTDLSAGDWLVEVPDACIAELESAIDGAGVPLDSSALDPIPHPPVLPACTRLMSEVRAKLVHGPGLAVVDRLPVERYGLAECRAIGWLLAGALGQLVAQKSDGSRVYDVKDSGKSLGYGVRRSVTNLAQPFHTDGPWLSATPAFVGLFCLQPGQEGGTSRFVSLVTVHNEMRRKHLELLPRLYRPFRWDRQAEHGPDELRWAVHPVYAYDGSTLTTRYYEDYVNRGYSLAGEALDPEGADALAAMREIVDDRENWVEFTLERGQFQYINNRQFAHSRTAFLDAPEPGRGRHLLRLWNRDEGTPHIDGHPPA
jgi:alpha-ketoglutarate-dependent taurine dioxygenase